MESIIDKLYEDKPSFHRADDTTWTSWNSNWNMLRMLQGMLQPDMKCLEIGSGYTTVVFIYKRCFHLCITPDPDEINRIKEYCMKSGISMDRFDFRIGFSSDMLPLYHDNGKDVILIDGAHAFPFPIVDWFFATKLLKDGGLMIIDDTDIVSCNILVKFLLSDCFWERIVIEKNFAVFRKLPNPLGDHLYTGDWLNQPFSREKIPFSDPLQPAHPVPPTIGSVDKVEFDWTSKFNYEKLTAEELEKYSTVEITADLREGGVHAQKAWGFWFEYLSKQFWKSSLSGEIVEFSNTINNPRILSLGCGYGGVEITIAHSLNKPYEITAIDINDQIFTKAREDAKIEGLNIHFLQLDLNFISLPENTFDVIFAHASLHHLLNLEHIFSQIHRGLKQNGRLIVQDIIGKTQVLFWKENVDFARDIVKKMPARYKAGIDNPDDIIAPYREPSIQKDMEGIRQEEIELQAGKFFTPVKMFKYGSFIRMICTHPEIGRRFDPDTIMDREYLEYLFQLDLQQVQMKKLRPTEMLAVYIKKDSVDLP